MTRLLCNDSVRSIFARFFSIMFFGLSSAILISIFVSVAEDLIKGADIMQIFLKSINSGVIALAVFELAMVVHMEYGKNKAEYDVIVSLRRTLPRFIGTVCVVLSLEGLIMVIKYGQLEMAGNLYYPVAIITSAALLLAALGVFLKLSPDESRQPASV